MKGPDCPCSRCAKLTHEERSKKWKDLQNARRRGGKTRSAQSSMKQAQIRGGKTRSAQPSMVAARQKAFQTTCDRHPYFARKWLPKLISAQNTKRAQALGMPLKAYKELRKVQLHQLYNS